MKISLREKKRRSSKQIADEQRYIIPTVKKINCTYIVHMIRRNDTHRLKLEGPFEGMITRGRPRKE